MKLYYAPGACSIGIHVLLEEIGKPYEREKISFADGAQKSPAYLALNPKGKVPLLVLDDGGTLTEFPAIALWLALTNSDKNLLPVDPEGQARTFEAMDYVVATVHMQGFTRMFRPGNFAPSEADHDAVKARGREIFTTGLDLMAERLGERPYLGGDVLSIADAALFYVEFWATRMGIDLPPACAAHFARMTARPAVRRVFEAEGIKAG
ncbi:MAG: glutathione S-transferase C-terminal domain-containing protein [Geminicoccaceae bacterium]|nr:glutathione S-transferase C-terminal domain-containing protein [Geminicoccaceae bacterium]